MGGTERVPVAVFRPVRSSRPFDEVVEQVLEGIRSGALREGDLLPPERDLARRMEVSRPTLRGAIGQLSQAGLLTRRPGRAGGTQVTTIWIPRELTPRPAEFLPTEELLSLLEARRLIEPPAARLAALRATEEQLARMRDLIEEQRRNVDDRDRALQVETRFHRVMWQAAGNPALAATLAGLLDRLEVPRDLVMRDEEHMRIAAELHEHTLDAIVSGDDERIASAMHEHLSYTEQLFAAALKIRIETPAFLLRAEERPARAGRPRSRSASARPGRTGSS